MGLDIIFIVGPKDIDLSNVETNLCDCEIGDTTCCNMWQEPETKWTKKEKEDRLKLKQFKFWKPDLSRNNTVLLKMIPYNVNNVYSPLTCHNLKEIFNSGLKMSGLKMKHDLHIIKSMLDNINFAKERIWVEISQ